MFCKLLSVYFAMLAFAGPGLCYCNILQLTHQKAAIHSHKNHSSQTNSRHQCGCKHVRKKHSAPVQPCSSNPACPSCPCNHHEQIPVVLPSVELLLSSSLDYAEDLNVFETSHFLSDEPAIFSANALSLICLSGWHQSQFTALEILRATFVLLC